MAMPHWAIGVIVFLIFILLVTILLGRFRHSPSSQKQASRSQSRQSNIQLENKLLRLLSGDRAAAERLLAYAKRRHPGKSDKWYWEKVISDLESDRR
ncbi:hypothetical protein [Funiculus sociatus]